MTGIPDRVQEVQVRTLRYRHWKAKYYKLKLRFFSSFVCCVGASAGVGTDTDVLVFVVLALVLVLVLMVLTGSLYIGLG